MIASVGSTIRGASRSSTRTSPGPCITAPRMSDPRACVVVGQTGRQLTVRVDLCEQEPRLLLDLLDGVLAGDPAQRRLAGVDELDERGGQLRRVTGLLAVH